MQPGANHSRRPSHVVTVPSVASFWESPMFAIVDPITSAFVYFVVSVLLAIASGG